MRIIPFIILSKAGKALEDANTPFLLKRLAGCVLSISSQNNHPSEQMKKLALSVYLDYNASFLYHLFALCILVRQV